MSQQEGGILNDIEGIEIPYHALLVEAHARRVEAFEENLASLKSFCLFIGYPRSGHSIVGSLIDAHANAVVAQELTPLSYLETGFSKAQVAYLLNRQAHYIAQHGRPQGGYKYVVPGLHHGSFERLEVLGDKSGEISGPQLARRPELLQKLRIFFGVPVKLIHVVRNPFDNISTIFLKHNRNIVRSHSPVTADSLKGAIDYYFQLANSVKAIKAFARPDEIVEIRNEQLLADRRGTLAGLCGALGLACSDDYLEKCEAFIDPAPSRTRENLEWPEKLVAEVEARSGDFEFLRHYRFS